MNAHNENEAITNNRPSRMEEQEMQGLNEPHSLDRSDTTALAAKDQDQDQDEDSSHCVICLNPCEDRTLLGECHHEFCFLCILQWSMISHSCPLCIQKFDSCIHEIQDEQHYTVHKFEPLPSTKRNPSMGSSSSSRSGTIRGASSSSSSVSQYQMTVPYGIIRQLYGPPQRRRRFKNTPQPYPILPETADERSVSEQQQQALEKRRQIYRHGLFVKHMGANRISGFEQITPETFKVFPQRIDRLIPWIRRELRAILSLSTDDDNGPSLSTSAESRVQRDHQPHHSHHHHRFEEISTGLEVIREYVIAVLRRYDLQTDEAQDLLRGFLEEHTEQFVHELMAFARSPYSIEAYDRVAQYDDVSRQRLQAADTVSASRVDRATKGRHHNESRYLYSREEAGSRGRSGDRKVRDRNGTKSRHRSKSSGSSETDRNRSSGSRIEKRRRTSRSTSRHSNDNSNSSSTRRRRSRSKSRDRNRSRDRARDGDGRSSGSRPRSASRSVHRIPRAASSIRSPQPRRPGIEGRTSDHLESSSSLSLTEAEGSKSIQEGIVRTAPEESTVRTNSIDKTVSSSKAGSEALATLLRAKLERERELYEARHRTVDTDT